MEVSNVVRVIAAAGLLLASCDSPLAPLPDGRPETFEFSYGGFFVGSEVWKLHGDTMVHVSSRIRGVNSSDTTRYVPTVEEWRTFWAAADRAGIRRWRGHYEAEGIIDGSGWALEVISGALDIDAYGNNAYPDSRGREHEGESTQAFRDFRAALDALSGRD